MNMVKDYVNIHLRLIQTDVLKFVIFLMTYLIKYMVKAKQKISTLICHYYDYRNKSIKKINEMYVMQL